MPLLERVQRPRLVLPYSENLLASNDFASGWSNTQGTLTANAARNADGLLKAATFVEDGTTNDHNFAITFTKAASAIAYELIAVARVRRNGALRMFTNFTFNGSFSSGIQTVVDLRTGEIITTAGSFGTFTGITRTTRFAGDGCWVENLKFTTDAVANLTPIWGVSDPTNTSPYAGDSVSGLDIFGGILRLQ